MDLETITAPAAEPLTLAQAKAHLRVLHSDEDDDITAMIVEARSQVEAFTRLRLITQTVRLTVNAFAARLALPVWPVQSVSSVVYDDASGVETALDASAWTLAKGKPRFLTPGYGLVWPSTRDHWDAVRVTIVAGYGASGAAVPADILSAIKLIVGSLYEERRGEIVGVSVSELPGMSAARNKLIPHVFF